MRCRKCGTPAVINMRQHRLALCQNCFLEWVPAQVQRTIEKYKMIAPGEKVLVAVSGGKDSLSLWQILQRLGYTADGIYINLGIPDGRYSDVSQEKVAQFAGAHNLSYHVYDVRTECGQSIPEIVRQKRGRSTCATCGLVKRHALNQVSCDGGYAALATGHNLDDEAAILLQNSLRWATGYLARQAPVLPASHLRLARKIRPLVRMYEREMAAYAILSGIDYIYEECPHARGATTIFYKGLLDQLEEFSPGAKQMYYLTFLKARDEGRLVPSREPERTMGTCEVCGQPTTAPGTCAFCRLWSAHVEDETAQEQIGVSELD